MNNYRDLVAKLENITKKYDLMAEDDATIPNQKTDVTAAVAQLRQLQSDLIKALSASRSVNETKKITRALVESFGYNFTEMNMGALAASAATPPGVASYAARAASAAPAAPVGAAIAGVSTDTLKTIGSFIPGIATGLSWEDAYERAKKGDWTGAGIAGLAGAAMLAPGIGKVAAVGLDALNVYRDASNDSGAEAGQEQPAAETPVPANAPTTTADIIKLQQQLKMKGADLGKFGPNKDGIDGKLGKYTRNAMNKYGIEQPTVAESIRSLQRTLEAIENQPTEADVDPELAALTREAAAKGLILVNKNGAIYLVHPPTQVVFDQQGQRVNPTTLKPIPGQPITALEGLAGSALRALATTIKNFSTTTAKKAYTFAKTKPKAAAKIAAGIAAGAGASYAGHELMGDHDTPDTAAVSVTPDTAVDSVTPSNQNISGKESGQPSAPGQNKEVQDIVRKMEVLMTSLSQQYDPTASGTVFDAKKQISQITGLPAELSIPLIPNSAGYSREAAAYPSTTTSQPLPGTAQPIPGTAPAQMPNAAQSQGSQMDAFAAQDAANNAAMSPERREAERRATVDKWDQMTYGHPLGKY